MAEQQSPTVEVAPTIIVSNSDGGEDNGNNSADNGENSGSDNAGDGSGTGELSPHNNGELGEDDTPPVVAVAEIEAERDVTIAAIHGETERERIRLEAERLEVIDETNKEYEECQRQIQELTERVETLALLIQPPLSEVVEEQLEIVPEPSLTEPSTAVPTVETLTEPSEESVEESLEAIPEIPVRGRRFIAI